MTIDPRITARNMQATRIGPRPPAVQGQLPGSDIPEKPSDDAAIVAQVKDLLTKAMELLANIGPGAQ